MPRSATLVLCLLLLSQAPVVACLDAHASGAAGVGAAEVHWGSGWLSECPCPDGHDHDHDHDHEHAHADHDEHRTLPHLSEAECAHARFAAFRAFVTGSDAPTMPAPSIAPILDVPMVPSCGDGSLDSLCCVATGPPRPHEPATDSRRLI